MCISDWHYPVGPMNSLAECRDQFRRFARSTRVEAPLYARLSAGIAEDDELAGLLLAAPAQQRLPVLLFACVHDLLLAGQEDPLARHYPNLTVTPAADGSLAAFRDFCTRRRAELIALLRTRSTQTNEVGRCALVLPALARVTAEVGPVALLDVGTSAGLTLLLDRYRYEYRPGGPVGPGSSVLLRCDTRGPVPVPAQLPVIAARRGFDRAPVDVQDDAQARWLEACVWPDQTARFTRLRAALELARAEPPDVRTGDAVADIALQLDELAGAGRPVVLNTWVLNYLTGEQRVAYVQALDDVGARRDLSWISIESPALTPELPGPRDPDTLHRTVIVLVRWRAGRRTVEHLADAHPHGAWLTWHAAPLNG